MRFFENDFNPDLYKERGSEEERRKVIAVIEQSITQSRKDLEMLFYFIKNGENDWSASKEDLERCERQLSTFEKVVFTDKENTSLSDLHDLKRDIDREATNIRSQLMSFGISLDKFVRS